VTRSPQGHVYDKAVSKADSYEINAVLNEINEFAMLMLIITTLICFWTWY